MKAQNTITVFVSGSKRLKEHRMRLKVLANDINGELQKSGFDITVNMYSYMNLGDAQKEYDDFIKHKSDIVFFLIEDSIGEKTRGEFLLASESFKKKNTPKLFVFLKEFQTRTPEIEDIEALISNNHNSYYVEYSNIDDLLNKARTRLRQEIIERIDKMSISPPKKMRKYKSWAIVSTIAFLALLCWGLIKMFTTSDDVILLFAGGGSAINSLKNNYENIGDVYSYENSITIGLPTTQTWALISQDILLHNAIKGDRVKTPYYPVSLSAKKAQEGDFLQLCTKDQFLGKGSVLSLSIGEDRLIVYVKKTFGNECINGKDSISVSDLCGLINCVIEEKGTIFTTQEGSGTLLAYRDQLAPMGVSLSKSSFGDALQWFTQQSPSSKIRKGEQPYLILGSDSYVAEEVYEEGDCRAVVLLDENNEAIKKSVFLYFAGYAYGTEGKWFWIPDEMVDFLKKINPELEKIIKDNLIPKFNEMVIVSLDDYLNEQY